MVNKKELHCVDEALFIAAVKNDHLEQIKDIKSTREMVNRLDETGKSALHYAVTDTMYMYKAKTLQVLLEKFKGNPDS